jgi:hypothetical protein
MLFWLFIIVGLIGVGLIVIGNIRWNSERHHFLWYHDDTIGGTGIVIMLCALIAIVISLLCICGNFMGIDADVAKYHEKYEALTYKMESGACRDEFGLLSKEVIDEIQYWNTDLTYRQNIQDDFWLGIYYPNVYDQFKTIDYTTYNRE